MCLYKRQIWKTGLVFVLIDVLLYVISGTSYDLQILFTKVGESFTFHFIFILLRSIISF